MSNVPQFSDEAPTRPVEPVPSRTLVLVTRVDRLLELVAKRLAFSPDSDAIGVALTELASARHLLGEVGR